MNEQTNKQEVITLIVEMPKKSAKFTMKEYPELNPMFEKGMYIETSTQCRLSKKLYSITFVFRHYNSV